MSTAMEKFIEDFDKKEQRFSVISPETYKNVINQIENYDMLFELAHTYTMAVLVAIPNNILSSNKDTKNIPGSEELMIRSVSGGQHKYFVIIEDGSIGNNIKYIVCHMYSNVYGFKRLIPCKYDSYGRYFSNGRNNLGVEIKIEKDEKNENKAIDRKIIEHIKKIITRETLINDIVTDYPSTYHDFCLRQKEKRFMDGHLTNEELLTLANICYTIVKIWGDRLRAQKILPTDVKKVTSTEEERNIMSPFYHSFDKLRHENLTPTDTSLTDEIIKEFENAMIRYLSNPKNYTSIILFDVDYGPNETFEEVGKLMKSERSDQQRNPLSQACWGRSRSWSIICRNLPQKTGTLISRFESISIDGTNTNILEAPPNFQLINEDTNKVT